MAQKGVTVANSAFPLYAIHMIGDQHVMIAGGGGQAKTGVGNAIEIYELKHFTGSCELRKVMSFDTDREAPMNCAVFKDDKNYTVAMGMDEKCVIYSLRHKIITPKKGSELTEGIRKRRGNLTLSEDFNSATKVVSFDMVQSQSVQTDFSEPSGFQKVVRFTTDHSLMVTGGADHHIRVWRYPVMEKLYDIEAHTDEIDDIDLSPAGNRLVSISKDSHIHLWSLTHGTKVCELTWTQPVTSRYRCRSCRYGRVIDKGRDTYNLFTTHLPVVRTARAQPCYITKWNTTNHRPTLSVSLGTDPPSALAVSDNGVYVAVGSLSGTVSAFVSFSLQKVYEVKQVHSIFVTGLDFAPSSATSRAITGNHDFTVFSISADNQVKMHQLAARAMYNPLWALAGFVLVIYLLFWLVSSYGL
ncbi:hypothetical protein NP493_791g00016 [Ridgeia piscesae]|uniref:Prolactin regulatory element-binding protein n=1 Tax=Ridgeia piscesae TaxID=27915 RepID=A0AAD9KMX7_RIDPI|nr:hypothetical protein NP493_791g00016 [Ridgeia piscesae]